MTNRYSLDSIYPNPFNPNTTITFTMPVAGYVELKVYDIIGRELVALQDGYTLAGTPDIKESINEETVALSKSDIKKMERVSEKLIKDLEKFLKVWKKKHKVSVRDSVLYDTSKDWEQAIRNLSMKFGGWFGFVYDSDYIK